MVKEYVDLDEINQVSEPVKKEKIETKSLEKKEANKIEKSESEIVEKSAEKVEKTTSTNQEKSDPRELKLDDREVESKKEKPQVKSSTNIASATVVASTAQVKDSKAQEKTSLKSASSVKENKTSKSSTKATPLKTTLGKKSIQKSKMNSKGKANTISKKDSKNMMNKNSDVKKKSNKEKNWKIIALLVIAAVIIGVIVYFAIAGLPEPKGKERVIAVVNGEPIYNSEIDNRYNLLQTTTSSIISKEQIINMTIVDSLLVQEAKRQGITTTDEEVEILMAQIMATNGIDEESLKQDLALKNVSYEYVLSLYKDTLTISKLINASFSNVSVSNEEIEAFYEANKGVLLVPDMVQVRHILFLFGQNSEAETQAKAEDVKSQIESSKSNFCDLVNKYTEDDASRSICGEYNFTMDFPFVPEFLDASFDMTPNEVRIVRSELGYHIIYKVSDIPEHTASIDDVRSQIEAVLLEDKTLAEYRLLINDLYEDAIIEIYSEDVIVKSFNQINKAEENETIETPISQESSEIQAEVEVTREVLTTEQSIMMNFANCLTDKGSRMFSASWSPDSKAQLEMFEEYASNLVIVECDESVPNSNPTECANILKKEFPTWPTWQINGQLYEGKQTLSTLARISGCSYN